jgi:SNF family Na+-dependent transporter
MSCIILGTFDGMSQSINVAGFFDSYWYITFHNWFAEAVIFYVICLILNTFILSKGIKGIEKVAKVGMPLLIFLELYW